MGRSAAVALAAGVVLTACSAVDKLGDALVPAGAPGVADDRVATFEGTGDVRVVTMSEGRLYWIAGGEKSILSGAPGEQAKTIVGDSSNLVAITVFGQTLYYATDLTSGSGVYAVDRLQGGAPVHLGDVEAEISKMVADSSAIYAVDEQPLSTDSRVLKIAPADAATEPLASGLERVQCLAIDDVAVYYCAGPLQSMSVSRVLKTGGTPQVLASSQPDVSGVAIAGEHVYWVNNYRVNESPAVVRRAKKTDGSAVEDLVSFEEFSETLAVNSTHAYYQGAAGIWRVPVAGGAAEKFINTKPDPGVMNGKNLYSLLASDSVIGWSDLDAVRAAAP